MNKTNAINNISYFFLDRAKDPKNKDKSDDTNTILCNNVEMIREKLAVSEKGTHIYI